MRKLLAALAVLAVSAVQPASGVGPPLHVVTVTAPDVVSVTCDTSSYPAASYPCELVVDASPSYCFEESDRGVGSGCRVSVRGPLNAHPALSPDGGCRLHATDRQTRLDDDPLTLTFDSDLDPSFHVEQPVSVVVTAENATASYGSSGYATGFTLAIHAIGSTERMGGALTLKFGFSDLAWDCRSRSGGDPASDPDGPIFGLNEVAGEVVFARPGV